MTLPVSALAAARIAVAALLTRTIGHDLGVEGGLAGKVCRPCVLQGRAIRHAPGNGDAQQRHETEAYRSSTTVREKTM